MFHRFAFWNSSGQAAALTEEARFPKINVKEVDFEEPNSLKVTGIVVLIGILLSRAVILYQLLPFVVPFIAVIYKWKRSHTLTAILSVFVGATTVSLGISGQAVIAILFYLVLQHMMNFITKQYKYIPIVVFLSVFASRFFYFIIENEASLYNALFSSVEGGIAMVITMIFFQSLPLVLERRKKAALKNEEIVCFVILLASLMTGTVGLHLLQLSMEQIIARYVVLIFAYVGGVAIGSTVGVVTGLILSLANVANLFYMSLFAFSGLLGGLLKEGRKIFVGIGLLVATLLIGMYGDNQVPMELSIYESLIAIGFFMATPKKWINGLSKFIPGTMEHSEEQQKYIRKIRDVTASKVEQFSNLFLSLSNSFSMEEGSANDPASRKREVDLFLSGVTENTCQTCMKKNYCWSRNEAETYGLMELLMEEIEENGDVEDGKLYAKWKQYCVKDEKVVEEMKSEMNFYFIRKKLKRQLQESRRLVADQLKGVSIVMEDFAKDIQKERKTHEKQESEIIASIERAGLEVEGVEVYSLEEGNIDIDITLPSNLYNEGEKIVAPILSHILNENITVKHVEANRYSNEAKITFGSTKTFIVSDGVAHAAKDGRLVSGDSYSTMELGAGKYAIALSDGMGNGKRAYLESQETIQLLKNILRSGIDETVAIKSINSILMLRSQEEVFSTLDLAMIDLQDGVVKFLKVGSVPSFLKRGSQVRTVESRNLPIGILHDVEVDVVSEQLKAGDLLIMMSDGIYDASLLIENKDIWLKRVICEIETNDPQEVADILLERVIRENNNQIPDDMTVIVARMDHYLPKWATITLPS